MEQKLAKADLTFFSLLSGSKLFHLTLFLRFKLNVKAFLRKKSVKEMCLSFLLADCAGFPVTIKPARTFLTISLSY